MTTTHAEKRWWREQAASGTIRELARFRAWRFLAFVDFSDDGCWLWSGTLMGSGYGKASMDRVAYTAHRLSHILFKGEIPEGHQVDHLCRNKACVNPGHLEAVTPKENMRRAVPYRKPHKPKAECKWGHEYTPENSGWAYRDGEKRFRYCKTCAALKRKAATEAMTDEQREERRRKARLGYRRRREAAGLAPRRLANAAASASGDGSERALGGRTDRDSRRPDPAPET